MRFEELASRAGKAAADVGRRADRPAFARILDGHRRRVLVAGWSSAAAVVMVVLGVSLWPGSGSAPSPAAQVTTTTATTPPPEAPNTTLGNGVVPGVIEGGRDACPVTEPGDSPFAPSSETPEGPPLAYGAAWYGTPDLWTMVQHQGQVWTKLPVGTDGSLTQKTFWWSDDYVFSEEPLPDITVTAQHLNGSAPTVEAGGPGTNASHPEIGNFMIVGLTFPQEGCWRITAEYRNITLGYVAWVDDDSSTAATDGLPTAIVDLLDGSRLEVSGVPDMELTGYFFAVEVPGIQSSDVTLSPGADPADGSAVDQAAVLESTLDDGVRLWRADREGQPLFMTVDLGGWVAFLHVGNQIAPETELLLSVADQLRGETSESGVVLANHAPDLFTTYLEDPNTDNRIHLAANQCIAEMVPGAEVVDHQARGALIRGPEYASWCNEDAAVEVIVHGSERFVEQVTSQMALMRTPSRGP